MGGRRAIIRNKAQNKMKRSKHWIQYSVKDKKSVTFLYLSNIKRETPFRLEGEWWCKIDSNRVNLLRVKYENSYLKCRYKALKKLFTNNPLVASFTELLTPEQISVSVSLTNEPAPLSTRIPVN